MMQTLNIIGTLYLVIAIHEMGHLLACILLGIGVEQVGIGVGPAIIKIKPRNFEFKICLLPLAGFTVPKGKQHLGWRPVYRDDFCSRRPWQRLFVLSAGVISNLILVAFNFQNSTFTILSSIIIVLALIPRSGTDGHEALTIIKTEL